MWDVPRFAEHHDYRLIITENVVDAARWVMFDAWLMAMASLGYEHHIVYMNSMHAQLGGLPAPQSRDRMYVVFWKKGNRRPDFDRLRPRAYCPGCDQVVTAMQVFKKTERWGRYRAQYNWRCPNTACRNQVIEPGWLPAAHAIDWTLKGERIGDRNKPLAEKTMARIRAGLEKYGETGEPYLSLMRSGRARNYPVTDTLQTLTTEGAGHCLVDPRGLVIDAVRGANIISHTDEPLRTQTTSYTRGLLVPVEGREGKEAASVMNAMRTQTTRNETALLMPYYGSSKPQPVSDPIGTLTTVDRYAMITLRGQNAPKDVYDPMDTFAANGNHHAVMGVKPPAIEDCTFRMLEPYEVTWGMAFPKDYIMTGNKREQVKQAGNAVCPPNARDLVRIGAESLSTP
jgi:DNA (cytosine-5)-methyltransferase 1